MTFDTQVDAGVTICYSLEGLVVAVRAAPQQPTTSKQLRENFELKIIPTTNVLGGQTKVSKYLNNLPVIPFDDVNDPEGMMRQGIEFSKWALALPNQPVEIILNYTPFDAMPRSWDVRLIGPTEVQALMLTINVNDIYDNETVATSIISAYPPQDEDSGETIWMIGIMALLKQLTDELASMQTEYIAGCFDADGWDANGFLEETDAYMNHMQQRIFLQGHMYMYELNRILREDFDHLSPDEQAAFPELLEQIRRDFDARHAECRAQFDQDMDNALADILDGK